MRAAPTLMLLAACAAPTLTEREWDRLQDFEMAEDRREVAPLPKEDPIVQLGLALYYDCELSAPITAPSERGELGQTGRVSCALCHDPLHGGSEPVALPAGVDGRAGLNAPSVLNAGWREVYGWNATQPELHEQIKVPLTNLLHNLDSWDVKQHVIARHRMAYEAAWGVDPHDQTAFTVLDRSARALAAFVRTLETGNSPVDAFLQEDSDALNDTELAGALLFVNKAGCADCHSGPLLSDGRLHDLGLPPGDGAPAQGTAGAHLTPTLRNVELSGPYMHDGRIDRLWEVLEFYNHGGGHDLDATDPRMTPLGLTDAELGELEAFLRALTGTIPWTSDELPPAACDEEPAR